MCQTCEEMKFLNLSQFQNNTNRSGIGTRFISTPVHGAAHLSHGLHTEAGFRSLREVAYATPYVFFLVSPISRFSASGIKSHVLLIRNTLCSSVSSCPYRFLSFFFLSATLFDLGVIYGPHPLVWDFFRYSQKPTKEKKSVFCHR